MIVTLKLVLFPGGPRGPIFPGGPVSPRCPGGPCTPGGPGGPKVTVFRFRDNKSIGT